MAIDISHVQDPVRGYYSLFFAFDDTLYSGGNTGDGCAFFDASFNSTAGIPGGRDLDGRSDFALCVSFSGNPTTGTNQLDQTMLFRCPNDESAKDLGRRCAFNRGDGAQIGFDNDQDGQLDGFDSSCYLQESFDPFPLSEFPESVCKHRRSPACLACV